MASTSARMLRLLSLLQTHRYWPGHELADRLEVSERTLRRDIDRLRDLGYPVAASRGVAGGYQLRSGTAMPPLLLDDEEAVAVAVGLRTAAGGSVDGIEETSVRALAKVVQVMPPRLRRRVDALRTYAVAAVTGGPTVDPDTLVRIAQACRDDERLRFDYATAHGDRASRLVEPHRLVSLGRRWYLVAWDVQRGDWRTFRVDRLAAPATTGARFRPRPLPGGDAARFVRERLATKPVAYDIVLRVRAPASTVAAVTAYTGGTVTSLDDGTSRLAISADAFDWPVLILAAVGADFDVEQPAEFRDYLRATAQRFIAATTGSSDAPPAIRAVPTGSRRAT